MNKPRTVLAILTLFAGYGITLAQAPVAEDQRTGLAESALRDVFIKESNLPLALAEIAHSYKIPIGIEISPEDDLQKERNIQVYMKSGTLRDLLSSVVSQNPSYTWNVEDNVVNVFPKGNREPFLKNLLETKIDSIQIPRGTDRLALRDLLTENPQVQAILASFGVKGNNEIFMSHDLATLGRSFSLNASNNSVKAILNRVIQESEAKFWIVNRYGKEERYLLVNVY
jgi:hypothetical protein